MKHRTSPLAARRRSRAAAGRRGVSSVLAMMFLVIFGSLAAAMAVVAQGNLRTADSHLRVSRAMSAAETGLVFATRRLQSEGGRFVVTQGVIDETYGTDLWDGTYASGTVQVLPPDGYVEPSPPDGVAEALLNAHLADDHAFDADPGDADLPAIDQFGTLRVKPIALTLDDAGLPTGEGPYFRLKYELVQIPGDGAYVKVTAQGVDLDITRTLQMLFKIDKKIEYAIIAPSRIMIGKNVRVEGPLGSRYGLVPGELDSVNGDPLTMRSDFYYLNADLDAVLDTYFNELATWDADGDGRLRLYHPTESQGLTSGSLVDYDGNEYVDDFDLFLAEFDANGNGSVVYDETLAAEVYGGAFAPEFSGVDDQLARLIDEANPDRDGDGLETDSDRMLGYRDGLLDINDTYAKVRGKLAFAVSRADWEAGHGESYQTVVHGPIDPGLDEAPVVFEASDEELRELTTDMFVSSQTWYENQVPPDGTEFWNQVAWNEANGGLHTPPDATTWESIPFEAPGAYDYYQREVFDNMTFDNVRVPMGLNALFRDCTFVGVTFIETDPDCTHENWNYAGAVEPVEDPPGSGNIVYMEKFPGTTAERSNGDVVNDTKPFSNNIRFDNCTVIGSIAGVKPNEYTHWRNKIQFTGNTRFYIYADDPDLEGQPDETEIVQIINDMDEAVLEELRKSSILLPGWSADIGNFSNEQAADPDDTPKVKLKGAIVAGILDVRGTADVFGSLLMTFHPVADQGPLFYGGLPDAFNTTIGYFGPSDGDGEGVDVEDADFDGFGEITLRYDEDAKLPDGIPWPITIAAEPLSYTEGGSM